MSAINAVIKLIYITEKAWNRKEYLDVLFLNIKDAFNFIVKNRLLKRIEELELLNYLIK